jgi:NAD(P)-dependent dehydrogenase (short-subunit alcohol dehydrogenase family)|tara:strand:- start:869 stop:1696 length:828 start_codon:yes stop_codon:yes gene_type:complete
VRKKNCIITGGTSGLGLNLVKKFINNGFFVHIIAKDNIKIKKLLNYFHERNLRSFNFYQVDLAEESELNRSILQIKNLSTIDVLINNAGALFLKKKLNSKGFEKTFAVNYLSHFSLTISLIDLIKKNKNARIVNISSMAHKFARLDLNDINFSKNYNGWIAYCNSKLMNILFNYKINRVYDNSINCYAVHPGWLNTNFGNNNQSSLRSLLNFARNKFAKEPSNVADEIYNLCTSQEYLNYPGKYLVKNKVTKSSNLSYRLDLQDKLWEMSLKMIN